MVTTTAIQNQGSRYLSNWNCCRNSKDLMLNISCHQKQSVQQSKYVDCFLYGCKYYCNNEYALSTQLQVDIATRKNENESNDNDNDNPSINQGNCKNNDPSTVESTMSDENTQEYVQDNFISVKFEDSMSKCNIGKMGT